MCFSRARRNGNGGDRLRPRVPLRHAVTLAALFALALPTADSGARAQSAAVPEASPPRSERVANYQIQAVLDPVNRLLKGTEVVTWRNATALPTSELRLHLYLNAWRNDQSSFVRSEALRTAGRHTRQADDWAYCDVSSVVLLSAAPSSAAPRQSLPTEFIQPDDGNPADRTVLRVALPAPVEPGGVVRLEIRWDLKIPRPSQRTGAIGSYFLLGQWFPKVGVFTPDGKWNTHQFIQTEFFADFGVYEAALTVPGGWVVGATGIRESSSAAPGGGMQYRFRAEDVHDFAWAASPHFQVHTDRFESPGLPSVDLELLLLPEHARLKDRYFASAKEALRRFGTWFRPYPWSQLHARGSALQLAHGRDGIPDVRHE